MKEFFRLVAMVFYTTVIVIAILFTILVLMMQPKANAETGEPIGCVMHFIMNGHMHVAYVSGNLVEEQDKLYLVDISHAADMLMLEEKQNYHARAFSKEDCQIGHPRPNHTRADIDYYDKLLKPKHYSDSFDELTEAGLK